MYAPRTIVGWVEALAETHHNSIIYVMGFALLYPSELSSFRQFLT
jgi:hypothetical protein